MEGVGRNGRGTAGAEDVRVAGNHHLRRTTGGACAAMKAFMLQRYGPEPLGNATCRGNANHGPISVMVPCAGKGRRSKAGNAADVQAVCNELLRMICNEAQLLYGSFVTRLCIEPGGALKTGT